MIIPVHGAGGIPHVCGGGPQYEFRYIEGLKYSPRMWGWTYVCNVLWNFIYVFPTYVGVDRNLTKRLECLRAYSPRMWGWTRKSRLATILRPSPFSRIIISGSRPKSTGGSVSMSA